jgi:Cupin domain
MPSPTESAFVLTMLLSQQPSSVPSPAEVMTATIELPPADPGTPPHRHSGPVFEYMLEGEMTFELEGEPERVIRAGEAFWEPGGDVIQTALTTCRDSPRSGQLRPGARAGSGRRPAEVNL